MRRVFTTISLLLLICFMATGCGAAQEEELSPAEEAAQTAKEYQDAFDTTFNEEKAVEEVEGQDKPVDTIRTPYETIKIYEVEVDTGVTCYFVDNEEDRLVCPQ